MKKYFRLNEECYLVKGNKQGCIYNIRNQSVYRINHNLMNVLELAENNYLIDSICEHLNIDLKEIEKFFDDLVNSKIGNYFNSKIFVDKVNLLPEWRDKIFFKIPPMINRAFINLQQKCEYGCYFCNSEKYQQRTPCFSCSISHTNAYNDINTEHLTSTIKALDHLNVNQIIFLGGDILYNQKSLNFLVDLALTLSFKNITVISPNKTSLGNFNKFLSDPRINLILITYVDLKDNNVFEDIIINENTASNITRLFLIDYESKHLIPKLQSYLESQNINKYYFDFIINMNDVLDIDNIKILDSKTSLNDFSYRKKYNTCLGTTISVHNDGNISTCPLFKNNFIGEDFELNHALTSDEYKFQSRLNYDKITPCKNCEIRYLCNDCRYLELKAGSEIASTKLCKKNGE